MAAQSAAHSKGWNFDNSYLLLPDAFYAKTTPEPMPAPKVILWNTRLAKALGVSQNDAMRGINPIAQAYAGHQFGHFNMLGDGRCHLLGEHIVENTRFDIQLKGSGATPFSRRGDGKATLPAMLREYIISEAMVGLGIPTTQSLAVTLTGEQVMRETDFAGAILTRVASSHLRVGTFQYAAALQDLEKLQTLTQYAIKRHYPDAKTPLEFLKAVITAQAKLIATWVAFGFIHGVMNTDNMTISGETIDYGPCAFMDIYDPNTVFSSIDQNARYAYANQGKIGLWNLTRLAESLLILLDQDIDKAIAIAEQALNDYQRQFQNHWHSLMRLKLGLDNEEAQDAALIQSFLDILEREKQDYTQSFHNLASIDDNDWQSQYQARLTRQKSKILQSHNPVIIARNFHVEAALAAANEGDFTKTHRLVKALQNPFESNEEFADLQTTPHLSEGYKTFCGT